MIYQIQITNVNEIPIFTVMNMVYLESTKTDVVSCDNRTRFIVNISKLLYIYITSWYTVYLSDKII